MCIPDLGNFLNSKKNPPATSCNCVRILLESVHTVLTQPGTLVSFRGMCILLVIRFPETPEFPMFSISGKLRNSDVSDFRKLRTPTFFVISHSFMYFTFHLWLRSSPLFHVLFSFMYSGLLSVPGTYLSHSLVYKHLYSVARIPEWRLLSPLLFLFHSSDSSSPSSLYSLLIFRIQKFPRSLTLGNPGSLRDSTGNRAIPWVRPGN